jgi:transcriptional regulator with XRE-family HTH domain
MQGGRYPTDQLQAAFGDLMRELRRQKGISQERLALEAGIDRTFLSKMERGLRQPSLTTIFILAGALDARPSELLRALEAQIQPS